MGFSDSCFPVSLSVRGEEEGGMKEDRTVHNYQATLISV